MHQSKSILRSIVERKYADHNELARVLGVPVTKVKVWLSVSGHCDLPEASARKAQEYFERMQKRLTARPD